MYCALYRKYRPLSFDDVVSQSHITTILKNQIAAGKTGHAYIFTGSRGTGKTTCARIFAKAVNCPNMQDGEPCLKCEICEQAQKQTLTDIVEIDAASNTGVDDVRSLKESAFYLPERAKYKIYIIDEVHMLSPSAFNALLKILEEPPEHIKFILATTEIHKIPATIMSRCQRFDFARIKTDDIRDRLLYIASNEDFTLQNDAADLIARLSDGGMRDALSMLDQCTAYSDNVTVDTVSQAVGISGGDDIIDIVDALFKKDPGRALDKLNELYSASKDMQRLSDELLSYTRNVMLIKSAGNAQDILTCTKDEYKRLCEISDNAKLDEIISVIETLGEINEQIYRSANKRICLEMGLVRLCADGGKKSSPAPASSGQAFDPKPLLNRIARLEEKLKGGAMPARYDEPKPDYPPLVPENQQSEVKPQADVSKLTPADLKPLSQWNEIVTKLSERSPATSAFMNESTAFVYGNLILIVVNNKLLIKLLKAHIKVLDEVITECLGARYAIRVKAATAEEKSDGDSPVSRLLKKAHEANIEVEVN